MNRVGKDTGFRLLVYRLIWVGSPSRTQTPLVFGPVKRTWPIFARVLADFKWISGDVKRCLSYPYLLSGNPERFWSAFEQIQPIPDVINYAILSCFGPISGAFGESSRTLEEFPPQKEEVTPKTEEKQRELTCHVAVGGVICSFITSFAGVGLDHHGWLRKKTQQYQKNNRTTVKCWLATLNRLNESDFDIFGVLKAVFGTLDSLWGAFLQRKCCMTEEQKHHNRKIIKQLWNSGEAIKNDRERSKE